MLRSLDIRRFRGFKDLKVEDLGRVNLIIGRNDVGKTSLMAAAALASSSPASLYRLIDFWFGLLPRDVDAWSTLFPYGELDAGLAIGGETEDGPVGWEFRRSETPARVFADGESILSAEVLALDGTRRDVWVSASGWLLDSHGTAIPSAGHVEWANHTPASLVGAMTVFREIVLAGREDEVATHVAMVSPELVGVDVVGQKVWVRLVGTKRRLPLSVLGDGARWMFDVAVATLTERSYTALCLDEVDAGMHHTSMLPLWKMIREGGRSRQIFATTHSDDCIRAACQVFTDAGDDGLRVIRLDRTETGHRAVSYTAADALYAIDNGWEIRG